MRGLARLVSYFVLFPFTLAVVFFTMRTAKDRGSDAERLLPLVRGNPERPKPKTGALTPAGKLPSVRGYPERPVGSRPRL